MVFFLCGGPAVLSMDPTAIEKAIKHAHPSSQNKTKKQEEKNLEK